LQITSSKLLLNSLNTLYVNKQEDIEKLTFVLSSDTRLRILDLADGRNTRNDILNSIDINSSALTKHLKVFMELPEHLQLLNKIKDGNNVYYTKKYDFILTAL